MANENVLVLGGNLPHRELIQVLKRQGFFVVLVDYLDNPPAKDVASVHEKVSVLDRDAVLAVAKKWNVSRVFDVSIDFAIPTMAYVSEQLGLPCPLSYQDSIFVTNKYMMKDKMLSNNILSSKYNTVNGENYQSGDEGLTYPLVVKPSDSTGNIGVEKVLNHQDYLCAVSRALQISRSKIAVVEEFIEGVEVSVDCYVRNGEVNVVLVRRKRKANNSQKIMYPIGSVMDNNYPITLKEDFQRVASQIVNAFHLDNTVFFYQAFLVDGKVSVIEFAVRFGGGQTYRIHKQILGYNLVEMAANLLLQNSIPTINTEIKDIYTSNYVYSNECVFDNISNVEDLYTDGSLLDFVQIKRGNVDISGEIISYNKLGFFMVKANNEEELVQKTLHILDTLEVYDADGKPQMRKDVYFENGKLIL